MIAAVETSTGLCIVKRVGREGFKAVALTYCDAEHNAGNGTVQVPDAIFKEGKEWLSVSKPSTLKKPCIVCKTKAGL